MLHRFNVDRPKGHKVIQIGCTHGKITHASCVCGTVHPIISDQTKVDWGEEFHGVLNLKNCTSRIAKTKGNMPRMVFSK